MGGVGADAMAGPDAFAVASAVVRSTVGVGLAMLGDASDCQRETKVK